MVLLVSAGCRKSTEPRDPKGYVGSEVCQPCHAKEHESWKRSIHFRNMSLPTPETVLGDFERQNEYRFEGTHSRMFSEGDRYFMEYTGPSAKTETCSVDYVLGTSRHQICLHQEPDGRLQVLPTHWNVQEGAWRDSREGPVTEGPKPLPTTHAGYWQNYSRTYNLACMECHSSQPHKIYDARANRYESTFDPAINCEACHGPAGKHVHAHGDPDPAVGQADRSLLQLASYPQDASIELCASCHARKRIYQEGFVPGESIYDYFVPDVWEAGLFFVDGRSSGITTYNYIEYMQSACFRRSSERFDCAGACHPSHGEPARQDPSVEESNAPCTRCHHKYKVGLTEHTFHAVDSEGSRCIECHMPNIDLMGMRLRDHSIGVPLPELTRRFQVPNACNGCHRYDSPQWAEQHMNAWYGDSPTFQAYRARLLDRAEVLSKVFGEGKGLLPVDALVRWLDDTGENVIQRASAARFLGRATSSSEALDALLRHRRDTHPLVRFYVIDALSSFSGGKAALLDGLHDSRRSIRVRAYEALRLLDPEFERDPSTGLARVRAEHQHRHEVIRADDPRMLSQMALARFLRGEKTEAERLLRRGVALTKRMPELRVHLVQLLLHTGRLGEADAQVRELEAIAPGSEEAGTTRAQLLMALGRPREALRVVEDLIRAGQGSETVRHMQATLRQRVWPGPPGARRPPQDPGMTPPRRKQP